MKNEITYELIQSLNPCYDPLEIGLPINYEDTVVNFIINYRDKVKSKEDILWVLSRHEFMTDREMRLYAVWCARKVQHLMNDDRSIKALDVAEAYANGNATYEELDAARDARDARAAAWDAAWAAAWAAQIDRLLEIFKEKEII